MNRTSARKGGHFLKLRHFPLAYVLAALKALVEVGESLDATKMTPKVPLAMGECLRVLSMGYECHMRVLVVLRQCCDRSAPGAGRTHLQAWRGL